MEGAVNILKFIRPGGIVAAIIVVASAWVLVTVLRRFLDGMGRRFVDRRLALQQLGTFLRFATYFLAVIAAVLLSFQLSEEALLALGGSIAVAIGIGLKDVAASVLAGLTILADRPFQVGDRVTFGDTYGEIQEIGLRSVKLVTLDDNLVTIPNNRFLTDVVASGNAGALDMLIQMDFFIGIDQDLPRAKQVVADAVTTSRYSYLRKPWAVLVSQVVHEGYFALRVRAKVYVFDVKYEKALETDVTERVIAGFREAGIEPPAVLHRGLPPDAPPRVAA